jgi:hypothetical protein
MAEKENKHQKELAQSGYRLPDTYYVEIESPGESAEKESGDGGAAAGGESQKSEHGYTGPLKSRDEHLEELEDARTVDPETGQTIPTEAEEQAAKATRKRKAGPSENK